MYLQVFNYEARQKPNGLTTLEINGQIWFVAKDVCDLLDIRNARDAVSQLDDDEKLTSVLTTSGQKRRVNLINESGLYSLVFNSRKESAKKFKKWVTSEVIPAIRKTGTYNPGPSFLFAKRYMENFDKIERGYFSVINELFTRLYAGLEHAGYKIPDRAMDGKEMRLDVSVGIGFSRFMKEKYPESFEELKKYPHHFPGGVTVDANQYPNKYIPLFIDYIESYWIPNYAEKYFRERDPQALEYLPKLLKSAS